MKLLQELLQINEQDKDAEKLEAWKAQVKKAYPDHAGKMKFKGYYEGGKNTVCAEVPGMDRCFGVFDMDKMKGEVLGEDFARGVANLVAFGGIGALAAGSALASGASPAVAAATGVVSGLGHYYHGNKDLWKRAKNIKDIRKKREAAAKPAVTKEEVVMEKRPAGAPKWHDSDAPDANGKFKELGVNDLADWLIKTRGGDMQKISGSLTQQIVFNRKKNPTYAKKMESVREAVKRKLAAKKKD